MTESIYLVVATSGRAIAQGLKALEYPVAVIDGFADQDCLAATNINTKVSRAGFGLDQDQVLQAVQKLKTEYSIAGLFYDAAIEADPELITKINADFVFGNSVDTLKKCKQAKQFFPRLDKHAIPYPEVRYINEVGVEKGWLLKHEHSSGGIGVNISMSDSADEDAYLQKNVDGTSFSITFLSNGDDIKVLGMNAQWSESLGKNIPYAYSGAINYVDLNTTVIETATRYAKLMTKEFALLGLNSIDCIYDGSLVYVLEVNPRIPASYELYETKYGELMREHIEVCKSQLLPEEDRVNPLRAHAIVYAPEDLQIPENMQWPLWTADRPHSGQRISRYEPICNVYSGGKNQAQVCEMIRTRKKTIISKITA